ncbi:MAG TPA: riboflavin synthase [Candidatus Binataceae bacterium]
MFTGIIEDLGIVESLRRSNKGGVLALRTALPVAKIKIGDSISVSGTCLTVIAKAPGKIGGRNAGKIMMDVSAETLRRSTMASLKPGDGVNLERCLTLDKLLSGHLVAGHVDGVGRIVSIRPEGESKLYTFEAPASEMRYLVEKGSVAIDGISLTVFALRGRTFCCELIPHTLKVTTLGYKRASDAVNLESDMLVKYVEKILQGRKTIAAASAS